MSDNDDIEKLLREIDGVTGSTAGAQPPARRPEAAPPAPAGKQRGQGMALAVSAVIGVVGLLLGFLPWVPGFWLGLGGFLGSYIALTIGRRLG